jgi:hypothetical protein
MAMFLKRDPKNRSYISRFLLALIRPFMSERPSQLPQLFFHDLDGPHHIQEAVVQWNTHMSQYLDVDGDNTYARCFLQHIEQHKCSDGVGHKFSCFTLLIGTAVLQPSYVWNALSIQTTPPGNPDWFVHRCQIIRSYMILYPSSVPGCCCSIPQTEIPIR